MRESNIEECFKREVERAGGIAYKFTSPGCRGVPDRLVVFDGRCAFVELKTPIGSLSKLQKRQLRILGEHGQRCYVLNNKEDIKALVSDILTGSSPGMRYDAKRV